MKDFFIDGQRNHRVACSSLKNARQSREMGSVENLLTKGTFSRTPVQNPRKTERKVRST